MLQNLIMIGSAATTTVAALDTRNQFIWQNITIVAIGFTVTVAAAFTGYYKSADAIEEEANAFTLGVGPYSDFAADQEQQALKLFTQRIEDHRNDACCSRWGAWWRTGCCRGGSGSGCGPENSGLRDGGRGPGIPGGTFGPGPAQGGGLGRCGLAAPLGAGLLDVTRRTGSEPWYGGAASGLVITAGCDRRRRPSTAAPPATASAGHTARQESAASPAGKGAHLCA
ncbi:hypothetical protein [Streptomyces sp. bgisy100]|uniref:hypothetical protein n=1 Tax=Streptomyces sp. bgisy100 TaxID=3413783 RepID=UPI003D751A41